MFLTLTQAECIVHTIVSVANGKEAVSDQSHWEDVGTIYPALLANFLAPRIVCLAPLTHPAQWIWRSLAILTSPYLYGLQRITKW